MHPLFLGQMDPKRERIPAQPGVGGLPTLSAGYLQSRVAHVLGVPIQTEKEAGLLLFSTPVPQYEDCESVPLSKRPRKSFKRTAEAHPS